MQTTEITIGTCIERRRFTKEDDLLDDVLRVEEDACPTTVDDDVTSFAIASIKDRTDRVPSTAVVTDRPCAVSII